MDGHEHKTWIFVSHASADLPVVRQIRNHLEERGASPLLFQLLALKNQEEFWPLIEREIAARDFFLFCESEAAHNSPWVTKEREAVRASARDRTKRIGSITVDAGPLDTASLDAFIALTRIVPSHAQVDRERVLPFLDRLSARGFQVFRDTEMAADTNWQSELEEQLSLAAREGWVVVFLSPASLQSEFIRAELRLAESIGAQVVPVLLDDGVEMADIPEAVLNIQFFDAWSEPETAPDRFADLLHDRKM